MPEAIVNDVRNKLTPYEVIFVWNKINELKISDAGVDDKYQPSTWLFEE